MDKTLHQLGGILLNGIPTFVLVLLLNVYLRFVFFKPLEKTLADRYAKTEGARKAAAAALAAADARVAEHQAALRAARSEVFEAQEKANCPIDTVVWVNLRSKIYHFSGTRNYGNTKDGAYMCERDTAAQGMRAAKNEQHP